MTILAIATLEYTSREYIKAFNPAQIAEFNERFPKWRDGGSYNEAIIDDTDMQWLSDRQISFSISRIKGLTGPGRVAEALNTYITQVHVPNVGLLMIDTVELLEDCCTNDLQDHLKQGWRIIAVCPPNSARRPDYILGRAGEIDKKTVMDNWPPLAPIAVPLRPSTELDDDVPF